MSQIKLTDILKNKKQGDEWYTFQVPEELHYWTMKRPWSKGSFKKYGVRLAGLTVKASLPGDPSKSSYTARNPFLLESGGEISRGFLSTTISKTASFTFRADDSIDASQILTELSKKVALETWEVKKLEVYNSDKGYDLIFQRHNPDGNGPSLYFYRAINVGSNRLYPEISLHEQQQLLAKFVERQAHCTAEKPTDLVHGCGLKKIKKNQIRKRKSGKWIHLD